VKQFFPAFLLIPPLLAQLVGTPAVIAGWNPKDPANAADGHLAAYTHMPLLSAVTVGPDGLVVLVDGLSLQRIASDGRVTTLIKDQDLNYQSPVTVDAQGNIYYGITLGIAKLFPDGTKQRIAGATGRPLPNAADGIPATSAQIMVWGLAADRTGSLLVSDGYTKQVWRIDSQGILHTVAGTAIPGTSGEGGPATAAQLEFPTNLAFDASGVLYIQDQNRILKVLPNQTLLRVSSVTTQSMAVDSTGTVYYAANFQIFRLAPTGSPVLLAGNGKDGYTNGCASGDHPELGDALTAGFTGLGSLAVDNLGNVLVVDRSLGALRAITPSGKVYNVSGAPPRFSGDGGLASAAVLFQPHGLAFDPIGNLYIADTGNNRIRRVTVKDGIIDTVAGQGGPTGDMTYACSGSSDLFLNAPEAIALDNVGNLYIADTNNNRIMKLSPLGALTRFAPNVSFTAPRAIGVDRQGNIWIGDSARRTLKLAPGGTILKTIPRVRPRSFSTDSLGNLYLTAAYVAYYVEPDDSLLPLAGVGQGSQIPLASGMPVELPDPTYDIDEGAGITRDTLGTLYNIRSGGVDIVSQTCHVYPISASGSVLPFTGAWAIAADNFKHVDMADNTLSVIWQLPTLSPTANDPPTPQLALAAPVMNAASMVISTMDQIVVTGGFNSQQERFIVSGNIAPGEIVRITGQCLGPFGGADGAYDSTGLLPPTLAGVQVTFGGVAAPLISVQAGSIVAVTPFALPSSGQVTMTVGYLSPPVTSTLNTAPYSPGLFRTLETDSSATALAVNQDGTLNSSAHPAPAGSIVALFATGLGQTNPASSDGADATNIALRYLSAVHVTVNGIDAPVDYAGIAPGFAGLSQINIHVPQTSSGPVKVLMGSAPFNQPVNLWIQ
jgi:uncharacterized protein (TIGR03437 family)